MDISTLIYHITDWLVVGDSTTTGTFVFWTEFRIFNGVVQTRGVTITVLRGTITHVSAVGAWTDISNLFPPYYEEIVAGAPKQIFVLPAGYDYVPGNGALRVTINGIEQSLANGDYVETDESTITLVAPIGIGEIIKFEWGEL